MRQSNRQQVSVCFHLRPRCAGRQMHRNNVEADSPFHYWKFALYNVFVDDIVEELEDQFIVLKTNLYGTAVNSNESAKIAADDQSIIKHSYELDINGDAFDMECSRWKTRWSGEQNPPSTFTTTLDALGAELYLTSSSFYSFEDSSDYCHCWNIFQLHEKSRNISSSYHDRYQAYFIGPYSYPLWFQGRCQLCNWLLQWEEKQKNQTDLNGNSLTLNNFDMPRTLFLIPKCKTDWEHLQVSWANGRVLCVSSVHKEEYQYSPVNKERIQNTWWMHQAFEV